MRSPSSRLAELGVTLPPVAAPLAAYVPAVRVGELVYSSGQLPIVDGRVDLDLTHPVHLGDAARAEYELGFLLAHRAIVACAPRPDILLPGSRAGCTHLESAGSGPTYFNQGPPCATSR